MRKLFSLLSRIMCRIRPQSGLRFDLENLHFKVELWRSWPLWGLMRRQRSFFIGALIFIVLIAGDGGTFLRGLATLWTPTVAEAAYTGKQLRTVEFTLGGGGGTAATQTGTDNNGAARASGTGVYAGTSWNTVKASAGTKTLTVPGSGIRVLSAYLDVSAMMVTTVNVTDLDLALDVTPGPAPAEDISVDNVAQNGTANIYVAMSGTSLTLTAKADVTSLLQTQTTAEWNSGLAAVGRMAVTGPTWYLATMKLIVTYEEDYSTAPHNELKTVRFPLRSTTAGDSGTKRSDCAAGGTCSFRYAMDVPDLATTSDIVDAWFELSYVDAGQSVVTPSINGGSAGTAHDVLEALADRGERYIVYRPALGAKNLGTSTQTLDVAVSAAIAVGGLGGELVVTYKYSTGAPVQAETVQYWMGQQQGLPGTASSTFTQTPTITNGGRNPRAIWFRVHDSITNAPTFHVAGKIGASATTTISYTTTSGNSRTGEMRIIHDMGAATTSWSGSATTLSVDVRHQAATYDGPPGVEAVITFYWAGSGGGAVTKTGKFFAGSSGSVPHLLNSDNSQPFLVTLPETVTKTYRSSYLSTSVLHSEAVAITAATVRIALSGSAPVTITEGTEDLESFRAIYVTAATSTNFDTAATIPWTMRAFQTTVRVNQTNEVAMSSEMVVTYDADFSLGDPAPTQKRLRTVEFALGGGAGTGAAQTGTDNNGSARVGGTNVYAGTAWDTTKATAGTKTLTVPGRGIRVISAYLDVTAVTTSPNADVTDIDIALDVSPGPARGDDVYVDGVGRNGSTLLYTDSSGLTPPMVSAKADVTALFQTQTDAEWNSGLSAVGMMTINGPNWYLATMKLVVTYEEDYNLVPHNELKTVRFPLRSTTAGDAGTKRSDCAIAATCAFTYLLDLPDLASTGDIVDVWFEINYVDNSAATAAAVTPSISGGAAGTSHSAIEVSTDGSERFLIYRPAIGAPNLNYNTTQTLNIVAGAVAVGALGGEVVITYQYSTGAATQVDTVQYWMGQQQGLPGTASSTFVQTPTITNGGRNPRAIWFRVHDSVTATPSFIVDTKIGSSATTSVTYAPTYTNPRGGEMRIIQDMGAATSSWSGASTNLTMSVRHAAATYDGPPGAEVFITFYWNGDLGGTITQTGKFFAGSSGSVPALANTDNSFPFAVTLPEIVTKTYRSSYLSTSVMHTDTATIIPGVVRFALSGRAPVLVSEATEDTEAFRATYLLQATSTNFTDGAAITWNTRAFQNIVRGDQTEEYAANSEMIVTYDAALALKVPLFTQNYFRLYVDNNAQTPTDPWPAGATNLGENTEVTVADSPPLSGTKMRIRMSYSVSTTTLLASTTQFRLEYATRTASCAGVSSWTPLGAIGDATAAWRGTNNTPIDGHPLSNNPPVAGDTLLSVTDRAGTYEEDNPSAVNPFSVFIGEDVEYDWVVQYNNAATNTPYCFRMAYQDGTALYAYNFYPTIRTAGYAAETKRWHWYTDVNNETPTSSAAPEITTPVNIDFGNDLKLRITAHEKNNIQGVDQKFRLQYSLFSDFSAGVSDVSATSSCTNAWCYYNGVDLDDAPISTLLLSDSVNKGRHNESPSFTSTYAPAPSTNTEFEYTIGDNGAPPNSTYFFRLYDVTNGIAVPFAAGESYPSVTTGDSTLDVTVAGLATSTATEGITTTFATDPTAIQFGTLGMSATSTGAQRFTVTTNATFGYRIYASQDQALSSWNGATIPGVSGTNASPTAWISGCPTSAKGCLGYHAGDDALYGGSARFLANDTWAALTSTGEEVAYSSGPVSNESTDIVYQVYVRPMQEAGTYQNRLRYIIVPIF